MNTGKEVTIQQAAAALIAGYVKEGAHWTALEVEVAEASTHDALERAIRKYEATRGGLTPRLDLSELDVALKWAEPGTTRSTYVVSGVRRAEPVVPAGKMPWTAETDGC